MTPAARIAAAIEVLDQIQDGAAAEKALTTWARRNRYAGSGDRAAVRDHVFDALRCKRSFAWLGAGETGRALMIGALRAAGQDPAELFTGLAYAPPALDETEGSGPALDTAPDPVQLDMPDWLFPELAQSLGDNLAPVLQALRQRAPAFLRVNLRKATVAQAKDALALEEIATLPHPLAETALQVTTNPRRIANSRAYQDGLVELQDAASQAVVAALPQAKQILDYCAGGGGKALALAAREGTQVFAHDIDPARMGDIPNRAERAGVSIRQCSPSELQPKAYDLVVCDAPCSGSGSWRRAPDAKWRLTAERLATLRQSQGDILYAAQELVAEGGTLAYATCSLLQSENTAQANGFIAQNPDWTLLSERQFTPLEGGDGFYLATFTKR